MSDAIRPVGPATAPETAAPTRAAPSDLHRVASEFEAMLLRQLLHTAKMGSAAGSYGDMAVDALATGISEAGGIGLTRQLEAVLAGQVGRLAAPAGEGAISRSSSGEGGRSGGGQDTP
jgi:Rod binding domain-containing protein